jgi:hypothetical protein
MPDEAREIIFPAGVPVTLSDAKAQGGQAAAPPQPPARKPSRPTGDSDPVATPAEAGLSSDAAVLEQQARQVKPLDHTENLLRPEQDPPTAGA